MKMGTILNEWMNEMMMSQCWLRYKLPVKLYMPRPYALSFTIQIRNALASLGMINGWWAWNCTRKMEENMQLPYLARARASDMSSAMRYPNVQSTAINFRRSPEASWDASKTRTSDGNRSGKMNSTQEKSIDMKMGKWTGILHGKRAKSTGDARKIDVKSNKKNRENKGRKGRMEER